MYSDTKAVRRATSWPCADPCDAGGAGDEVGARDYVHSYGVIHRRRARRADPRRTLPRGPRIADGGMATVYLAVDERLDREVALKVMRPHLAQDEGFVTASAARPARPPRSRTPTSSPSSTRARTTATSSWRWSTCPARPCARSCTSEGPLPPGRARHPRAGARRAPRGAPHGLIHRDVKPENVIITTTAPSRSPTSAWPGRCRARPSPATQGVLLGTVAYLSPEQVERGIADARSDVYAAGLMLFEMLTGTKAFTGETPIHVAYQHVHGGVPTPSSRIAGLPPALDDLVAVATARDPDERPADAGEFLDLVRRTRASLPSGALDARPAGVAAVAAASLPTSTKALPVGGVGTGHRRPRRWRGRHPVARRHPGDRHPTTPARGPGRRRWRRRTPTAALVAGHPASALVAALSAWFFLLGPGATATVPSVQGREQASAVSAVRGGVARPQGVRVVRREGRQGRRHLRRSRAGHEPAPWCRRRARGVQGARAVCRATDRRHDARRGDGADRGGQPRRWARSARRSTRRSPTGRSSRPSPGRARA